MRFIYEYKTSENERRRGEIAASSRSAVYVELKKQGIRPYKVELAPGLGNWLLSLGKRTAAIVVLAGLCVVLGVVVMDRGEIEGRALPVDFDSPVRRQIIGDTAVIEKGIRTGWADVFELEGERFLASFAIPGVPAGQRSTTEENLREALQCQPQPSTSTSASLEARQIRAMVEGMKAELRQFLSDGGTVVEYGQELVKRQEAELGYYNRAKVEIEAAQKANLSAAQLNDLWEKRNESLRQMGIKLIPMPE